MLEVALINIKRIHLLRKPMFAQLSCLINFRFPQLRILAAESFCCLAIVILLTQSKESNIFNELLQNEILDDISHYIPSKYNDTTQIICENLPIIFDVIYSRNIEF